ncbi:MAG: hypothetical protein RL760_298, partial [Candidatus Eisenbacteria bacterium]
MKPMRSLDWRTLTMVFALLAIWAVFSVTTDGMFLSPRNLSLLARQMSVTSLLATGMVLVIVAGQIDLSVGAMSGLLGALAALAATRLGWPLPLAYALAPALGVGLGAVQGSLVSRLRIPPFIVTLGGMLVFQGALLGITRGVTITPPPAFLGVGQTYLPAAVGLVLSAAIAVLFARQAVRSTGTRRLRWIALTALVPLFVHTMNAYAGVPVPVLLLVIVASLLALVATRTPFGRHLYAIGGNREAAFYSGVPIERRITGVFMLMGALA